MPLALPLASKTPATATLPKCNDTVNQDDKSGPQNRRAFECSYDSTPARTVELAQNELLLRRRMRNSMQFERLGISGPIESRETKINRRSSSLTSSGSMSTGADSSPRASSNADHDTSSSFPNYQPGRARATTTNPTSNQPKPYIIVDSASPPVGSRRASRSGVLATRKQATSRGRRGSGRARRASISSPASSLLRLADSDTMFSASAHNLLLNSSRALDSKQGDLQMEEGNAKFLHRKMSTPGTIGEQADGVVMRMRIYEEATCILANLNKRSGHPLAAETVTITKRELGVLQRSLALCAEPEYTVLANDRLELPADEYGEEVKRYLIQEYVRPEPPALRLKPTNFIGDEEAINHANVVAEIQESTSLRKWGKQPTPASSERSSVVKELKLERSQANLKRDDSAWMSPRRQNPDSKAAWRMDSDIVTSGPLVTAGSSSGMSNCENERGVIKSCDDECDMLESAKTLQAQGVEQYLERFDKLNEWGCALGGGENNKYIDGRGNGRRRRSRALTREEDEAEYAGMARRTRSASPAFHHSNETPRRQTRLGSSYSWAEQKQSGGGIGSSWLGIQDDWPVVETDGVDNKDQSSNSANLRRRSSPMMTKNPSMLLSLLLQELDEWDFDIFLVEELAPIGSMHIVTFAVFERHMMLETFSMDENVLNAFLRKVQSMYPPNPYHNSIHAADVVQAVSHSLVNSGLDTYAPSALSRFALLFAAVVHDINHPGVNNNFLIHTQQDLAIIYNDISPLENMHVATAFQVLQCEDYNITQAMSKQERITFRAFVVPLVLATDNAEHSTLMSQAAQNLASGDMDDPGPRATIVTKMALHAADVSSSARPWEIYQCWSRRIIAEFRQQGDRERALGLAVIPLMDRQSTEPVARFQAGFVSAVVKPLYDSLQKFPRIQLQQTCELIAVNLVRLKRASRLSTAPSQPPADDHVDRTSSSARTGSDTDSCCSGSNSTLTAFSASGIDFVSH